MKLRKVQIRNFRSIKHEDIVFNPRCRVLVGINESGKSNILDALSLLSDDCNTQPDDEREQLPDETEEYENPIIRFIFELDEDMETFYSLVFSQVIGGAGEKIVLKGTKNYTIKEYCNLFQEGIYQINIRKGIKFPTRWSMETDEFQILDGWKKPSPNCPEGIKFTDAYGKSCELKKILLIKPMEEFGIPEQYLVDATFDDFNQAVDKTLNELIEECRPEVVCWRYADNQLLPERINLAEFIANPDKFIPLKNMFHLAGVSKIKESIELAQKKGGNQLNNLFRRVAQKNTEHFQKVWKEYRDIKFSLVMDGDFVKCSITEKNDFAFQKRSDGFKKFVAFLLTVSTKSHSGNLNNALVLIDEPDAGLHPSGARYLRDELIKISKNNYVVYSTHSIFMIDRHNIGRHLIIKKKDEVTTTQEANEGNVAKEEVIFNAINYSTFEHLKEINVVLEGWRDRKLLEVATKGHEAAFFKKIGIAHADGVSSYKGFIPTLELAERKALIVSDNDIAAKNVQKEYQKLYYKSEWKRYDQISSSIGSKTGEDFLKRDYLVLKLKSVTKQHRNEVALDENNIPEDNRLNYIRQQLRTAGFTDESIVKEVMNDFKTALFESLPKTKIEDRYKNFLNDLKIYIENNLMPND